jgi:hypothetical protein
MAFSEYSEGGTYSSTGEITVLAGDANGTKLVKNLVVHNLDNVNHSVIIEFKKSGTSYRMFNVTLAPGDTLVQDLILALPSASYTLVTKLGEAATTQPKFVVTFAQVS